MPAAASFAVISSPISRARKDRFLRELDGSIKELFSACRRSADTGC
jgi:hypothetical protein